MTVCEVHNLMVRKW